MRRSLPIAALALLLSLVAGRASAFHISFDTSDEIEIRDGSVWVNPEGLPEAEITAAGNLRIDGHAVALRDQDRRLLARYNRGFRDVKDQAIDLGFDGVNIGISALAAAVVAVATGDHDYVEKKVEPDASRMKAKAKELCREVRELHRLQDDIAARVSAFRPYAVMDGDGDHDCHVDD
jgi:hypothetical protein